MLSAHGVGFHSISCNERDVPLREGIKDFAKLNSITLFQEVANV